MLTADSREKDQFILKGADERRLLRYDGPEGQIYSYDLEVLTAAGQILKFERKSMADCIQSFAAHKLDRQCAAVDALIVEWDDMALQLNPRIQDPKFKLLAENCKRHLWRMALAMPVLWTTSPSETVSLLRWMESKAAPLDVYRALAKAIPTSPWVA